MLTGAQVWPTEMGDDVDGDVAPDGGFHVSPFINCVFSVFVRIHYGRTYTQVRCGLPSHPRRAETKETTHIGGAGARERTTRKPLTRAVIRSGEINPQQS